MERHRCDVAQSGHAKRRANERIAGRRSQGTPEAAFCRRKFRPSSPSRRTVQGRGVMASPGWRYGELWPAGQIRCGQRAGRNWWGTKVQALGCMGDSGNGSRESPTTSDSGGATRRTEARGRAPEEFAIPPNLSMAVLGVNAPCTNFSDSSKETGLS